MQQHQFSQEFQAVGNFGDSFTYVLGAYYFNEHVTESAATPFTNVYNADGSAFTIRLNSSMHSSGWLADDSRGSGARNESVL